MSISTQANAQLAPTVEGRPISVFISYARQDRASADLVVDALHSLKLTTFLDTRDIDPSADFSVQLEQRIINADYMVVCVTPDLARHDSFVRREIAFALGEDRRRRARNPSESLRIFPLVFPGGTLPVLISTWTALAVPDDARADSLAMLLPKFFQQPATPERRDISSPELQQYLHDFLADVVDLLGKSVDGLLDLESRTRSDLTKADHISSARRFRVSSALEPLHRARSNADESLTEVFPNISAACDHFGGRLLVVGAPGSGKTTTLLTLARDAAVNCLSDPSCPIPVLAQLNNWVPGSNVREWATNHNVTLLGQPLFLLLDGLDEITVRRTGKADADPGIEERKDFLATLARDYSVGSVVVTCRVQDFERLELPVPLKGAVELSELSREQIASYLATQGVDGATPKLTDELVTLIERPLLLALLRASLVEADSDLSRIHSESDIFDRFVAARFRHETARNENPPFSQEDTLTILGRLAARRVMEHEHGLFISTDDISAVFDGDAKTFVEFCIRMHLLRGDNKYPSFVHLRMRDYFAAPELLRAFDAGKRWRPPWKKPEKYGLFDVEFAFQDIGGFAVEGLRLRTLRALNAEPREPKFSASAYTQVLRCFSALERSGTLAIQALTQIASEHPRHITQVVDAIGTIGGAEAVYGLLQLLGAKSDKEVIMALGLTDCGEAVQPLLTLVTDLGCRHRALAAKSLFRLRKYNRTAFLALISNDDDADVRLWAAADALASSGARTSDALRHTAIAEVISALSARRYEEDMLSVLRGVSDPSILEATHAALRRELELARANPGSSQVIDRIRLIQLIGTQSPSASIDVLEQAMSDRGRLPSDRWFRRETSVRDAAMEALGAINSAVTRSAVAQSDSNGVLTLARSFAEDPSKVLNHAAQRILDRPQRRSKSQRDSLTIPTLSSAVAAVALAAILLWWPALIAATIAVIVLLRSVPQAPGVVLFAPDGRGSRLWIREITEILGQGNPILVVTGADLEFSSATRGRTIATTATLAIGASFFIAHSAHVNWFWTAAYLVTGSLIMLRFPSTTRHWGTLGFFSAFLVGRSLATMTHLPVWLTLLVSVAVFLVVSFVFSKRKFPASDAVGTVDQLESLAAELEGTPGRWRRWLSPVPSNRYVIRCVDWALSAVVTIVSTYAGVVWLDTQGARPHHIRDLMTLCSHRSIPLMAIVPEEDIKNAVHLLSSLGLPPANICVLVFGQGRISLRPLRDFG